MTIGTHMEIVFWFVKQVNEQNKAICYSCSHPSWRIFKSTFFDESPLHLVNFMFLWWSKRRHIFHIPLHYFTLLSFPFLSYPIDMIIEISLSETILRDLCSSFVIVKLTKNYYIILHFGLFSKCVMCARWWNFVQKWPPSRPYGIDSTNKKLLSPLTEWELNNKYKQTGQCVKSELKRWISVSIEQSRYNQVLKCDCILTTIKFARCRIG